MTPARDPNAFAKNLCTWSVIDPNILLESIHFESHLKTFIRRSEEMESATLR